MYKESARGQKEQLECFSDPTSPNHSVKVPDPRFVFSTISTYVFYKDELVQRMALTSNSQYYLQVSRHVAVLTE